VHIEEVTVFFILGLVFDQGEGIEGTTEVVPDTVTVTIAITSTFNLF